jgi:hypothetical protein
MWQMQATHHAGAAACQNAICSFILNHIPAKAPYSKLQYVQHYLPTYLPTYK